jgi:hypothetical protein
MSCKTPSLLIKRAGMVLFLELQKSNEMSLKLGSPLYVEDWRCTVIS